MPSLGSLLFPFVSIKVAFLFYLACINHKKINDYFERLKTLGSGNVFLNKLKPNKMLSIVIFKELKESFGKHCLGLLLSLSFRSASKIRENTAI